MSKELALEYLKTHRNHCQTTIDMGDNTDAENLAELDQAIEWVEGQELLIHSVTISDCNHDHQKWEGTPKRRICQICKEDRTDESGW